MKAALFYVHAASNWGDLAINKGVINLLKDLQYDLDAVHGVRLPHNVIHTLNSDISLEHIRVVPVEVSEGTEGGSDTLTKAYEYLTDIQSFITDFGVDKLDVLLLNSGEHLFENIDGSNLGDVAWRILPLVAGAHAQVPVVQLPVTVGPFYTHRVSNLFERFLSHLERGAVRDDLSEKIAGSYGGFLDRVLDPGFFGVDDFPEKVVPESNGAVALIPRLEDFGLRAGSRRSAYVLAKNRDVRYEMSRAYQVYLSLAQEILANSSNTIHLIIQTWADRELIQHLYAALASSAESSRVWLHDPTDYKTFTDCLASMDVVVTSRFHAAILALTQAVPAVGVYSDSHGHKMPGLFSMLGIPQNAVRLQDRLTETVVHEICKAIDYSKENREETYGSVVAWRKASKTWLKDSFVSVTDSRKQSDLIDMRTIDQVRIDLLYQLHRQIIGLEQRDNYQSILARLKKIESRFVDH